MYIHITSRMHLSKQLISEHAHTCPCQSRNEPLMILITAPPLVTRKGITRKIHRLQSFPHTWPRLNSKTCKVCRGFSVESNSFSSQTRIANPKNIPTTSCRNNPMPICNIGSNQINNTTRSRQPPSRAPARQNDQSSNEGEECQQAEHAQTQERLRGAFTRPRSKTMTTLFPPNMTNLAVIRTNGAGDKPPQPPPQVASKETA